MDEFMREALDEAKIAYDEGEVPVGAVVVKDGKVIARAHNETLGLHDATAHAELLAIRRACEKMQNERLTNCELYVTAEPCAMCAGAIVWARIKTLYLGASDPKAGACGSLFNIASDPRLNHRAEVVSGVLESECSELLRSFFRERRAEKKAKKAEQYEAPAEVGGVRDEANR